eukprot:Phypoly_transcript_05484.p1 GENE.Phypoly_transcript_05484~~Phypoly_transcript_05484.p1  ORF type:complete len:486 (+),score=49.07 Phypoly_transcript_05484:147-1604(+)
MSQMDSSVPATPTPLPRRPIYIICAILFCEAFVSSMIFPFVNFMVADFHIAKSQEEVGYYSGYLASSFFLGQFASSYVWGYLSDKYGRRPILLIGVFGSMVSTSLFGISPSYGWAIAIRTFGGLMNSNFAIARSYIGDITDATNRVRGFSFVGLMWGAGAIFGPSTGGLLTNPGEHIDLSPDNLLKRYPYILPSVVSGILSLISWFVALLFLKESNKAVILRQQATKKSIELQVLSSNQSLLNHQPSHYPSVEQESQSSATSILLAEEHTEEGEGEDIGEKHMNTTPNKKNPCSLFHVLRTAWLRGEHSVLPTTQKGKYMHLSEETTASTSTSLESIMPSANELEPATETGGLQAVLLIFKDRSVMVAICLLALASLCVVAVDELFPLWASNKPPVGLDFKPATIGLSWVIGGVTLVLFQGLAYPWMTQRFGLLTMIRCGSIGFACDYIAFPMLARLAGTGVLLWFALGAVLFARYVAGLILNSD